MSETHPMPARAGHHRKPGGKADGMAMGIHRHPGHDATTLVTARIIMRRPHVAMGQSVRRAFEAPLRASLRNESALTLPTHMDSHSSPLLQFNGSR